MTGNIAVRVLAVENSLGLTSFIFMLFTFTPVAHFLVSFVVLIVIQIVVCLL